MSTPRDNGPDLSLERLGDRSDRDGLRPAHLSESALISHAPASADSRRDAQTAYEALVDAVFTAAGATEWLFGLRRAVTAMLGGKVQNDAIRRAEHGVERD